MSNIETTVDAFLDGSFRVVQPTKGHRAGLDALLIAATVPDGETGHIADFGAGAGVAGLAVAARCSSASVDLVERDRTFLDCLERSLTLTENSDLSSRCAVIETDIEATATRRREAGLADNHFDLVIANPPYNGPGHRSSPTPGRAAAHDMKDGTLEVWSRAAAACLRSDGAFHMILRPETLQLALEAVSGRFGAVRVLPIHPKVGDPANRMLIGGRKGSRAPVSILPALVLHRDDGTFTPLVEAVLRDQAAIPLTAP